MPGAPPNSVIVAQRLAQVEKASAKRAHESLRQLKIRVLAEAISGMKDPDQRWHEKAKRGLDALERSFEKPLLPTSMVDHTKEPSSYLGFDKL